MAIAISAWFDDRTESFVREIWKTLADAGLSRTLHDGPYRPHVTLAIYDSVDTCGFPDTLRRSLVPEGAFPVIFAGLGAFLNHPPTAQLTVTMSGRLLRIHRVVHELLEHSGQGPVRYHLPDLWNPHCTLAFELPESTFPRAMALLSTLPLPFQGTVNRIGIIDTPAEVELDVVQLANSGS